MRRVLVVFALASCGSDKPVVLPPTDQAGLETTLEALSAMGQKQAGTPAGMMASSYIQQRFMDLGLTDVHFEEFQFPQWSLQSKSVSVTIDGTAMSPGFDVFEASGSGTANGAIVDVGNAAQIPTSLDLTGKIALVQRDPSYHRSSQLRNVAAKGATAMLYVSVAPQNLRQVGSVRLDWEAADPIPAVSIGADDGKTIMDALAASKTVTAQITVMATSTQATGRNVVARIPGEVKETIVIGAHYDTWFSGSSDNGSGVAELIEVAHRRLQRGKPHFTTVFVAYDGEEIGLYGGYDYYRKHHISGTDPMLVVLNLESPSALNPDLAGLVHSNQAKLDDALQKAKLRSVYVVYTGLEVVAQLFGGIIPTDIQGDYRGGTPTATTAVTNPYYHTVMDTPDKVDLPLLADSTDGFDLAIGNLDQLTPADLAMPDDKLWTVDLTGTQTVDVIAKDGSGAPQANAVVKAAVLVDDFIMSARVTGTTDANGHAQLVIPASAFTMGSGNRYLHVTAGPIYPLVEKIVAL